MKDEILQRYLRYANYAEVLRAIAAETEDGQIRDIVTTAAEGYDQMAILLLSLLRSKATLEP